MRSTWVAQWWDLPSAARLLMEPVWDVHTVQLSSSLCSPSIPGFHLSLPCAQACRWQSNFLYRGVCLINWVFSDDFFPPYPHLPPISDLTSSQFPLQFISLPFILNHFLGTSNPCCKHPPFNVQNCSNRQRKTAFICKTEKSDSLKYYIWLHTLRRGSDMWNTLPQQRSCFP